MFSQGQSLRLAVLVRGTAVGAPSDSRALALSKDKSVTVTAVGAPSDSIALALSKGYSATVNAREERYCGGITLSPEFPPVVAGLTTAAA